MMFLAQYLNEIIALLGVIAVLFWGEAKVRKGENKERKKQKEVDNETAKDIRDRVRAHKSDGLRTDELKYRD